MRHPGVADWSPTRAFPLHYITCEAAKAPSFVSVTPLSTEIGDFIKNKYAALTSLCTQLLICELKVLEELLGFPENSVIVRPFGGVLHWPVAEP